MLKQSVLATIAVASITLCGIAYARTQTPGPNGQVTTRGPQGQFGQGQFGQGQQGQPGQQGQFGQGFGQAQTGPITQGGGGGVAIAQDDQFLYVVNGPTVFKITKADMHMAGQLNLRSTRPIGGLRPTPNTGAGGGQFGGGQAGARGGGIGGGQGSGNNQ